jgi:hypothetical protein
LALVHHAQQNVPEAQRCLAQARQWYESHAARGHAYSDSARWNALVEILRQPKTGYFNTLVGLAEYRAGRHADALRTLLDSEINSRYERWPVLALIHHANKNDKEATSWLERASQFARRCFDCAVRPVVYRGGHEDRRRRAATK